MVIFNHPTIHPLSNPSYYPSTNPTVHPLSNPTYYPSFNTSYHPFNINIITLNFTLNTTQEDEEDEDDEEDNNSNNNIDILYYKMQIWY